MAITAGPIIFLTPGSAQSLAALPGLTRFAAALGRRLIIMQLLERPGQPGASLAALAGDGPPPDYQGVSPEMAGEALRQIAGTTGGVLALLPRRPGVIGRLLIGSEYERLLRGGPLPVLALPADGRVVAPARVLFPTDLAPRSMATLDETAQLCCDLDAELHLLHVFGDDRLLPAEQEQEARRAAQSPRALMELDRARLQALAERAAAEGARVRCEVAEGRAHAKILSYAAANEIDLIVMASHGPRSAEDIFRGSTTVRVIHDSPVPVLAVAG